MLDRHGPNCTKEATRRDRGNKEATSGVSNIGTSDRNIIGERGSMRKGRQNLKNALSTDLATKVQKINI